MIKALNKLFSKSAKPKKKSGVVFTAPKPKVDYDKLRALNEHMQDCGLNGYYYDDDFGLAQAPSKAQMEIANEVNEYFSARGRN
ncbi:hypothetical protein [Vibrio parahaemolyticus]|uniref:hypothetical protein n=1 Tax=Vibrio parahaemolyticus TaxID=670 RepID=UPI0004DA7FDE|nr:hypothetical protein [Vibrio parahaemolyticus]EKF6650561.1 hypothetical protein [Vibrio parahaemolyticus]OQU46141.1 hypothetical protein EM73_006985 [Vibrio parahaemolyticus]